MRGVFDIDTLKEKLLETERKSKEEGVWNDPEKASIILKEQKELKNSIEDFEKYKEEG